MRLLVSGLILLIAALDFAFGRSGTALHIAGLVAGIVLALTVIIDRLWLARPWSERDPPPTVSEV